MSKTTFHWDLGLSVKRENERKLNRIITGKERKFVKEDLLNFSESYNTKRRKGKRLTKKLYDSETPGISYALGIGYMDVKKGFRFIIDEEEFRNDPIVPGLNESLVFYLFVCLFQCLYFLCN